MTYVALVVVVAVDDADPDAHERAWKDVSSALRALDPEFIGDPWPIEPTVDDDGFDTLGAFDQHPER